MATEYVWKRRKRSKQRRTKESKQRSGSVTREQNKKRSEARIRGNNIEVTYEKTGSYPPQAQGIERRRSTLRPRTFIAYAPSFVKDKQDSAIISWQQKKEKR